MFILAIVGLARSGKDTAARYISKKYGFFWIDMSRDVLEKEVLLRKMKVTKENLACVGDALRKVDGMDIVARKTLEIILKENAENIIVSGIRSPEEMKFLKKSADRFKMIKISSDIEKRIKRSNEKDLISRDEKDMKNAGLSTVLEMADATIENEYMIEDFYKEIDKTMHYILERKI